MDLFNADFLFDNQLIAGLESLIKDSRKKLYLISPFIDLDNRIKDALKEKIDDPAFELKVLFGKNETNYLKSITPGTLDFLKRFPNVEIRYNDRLHAKFYMNDFTALITSLNLYKFSLANNIEVGILWDYATKGIVGKIIDHAGEKISQSTDKLKENLLGLSNDEENPVSKFCKIFDNAELFYKTTPEMVDQAGLMGMFGAKKMNGFKVEVDKFSDWAPKKSIGYKQEFKETKKDIPILQNQETFSNAIASELSNSSFKKLSASQLSKILDKTPNEIISYMQKMGLIIDNHITDVGRQKGLEMRTYMGNNYVVYPENLPEIINLKKNNL